MKSFADDEFPLSVTDIPYGEVNRESNGLRILDKEAADVKTFTEEEFVDELVRVTSGSIYIFCGTEQVSAIRKRFVEHSLSTRLCIWEKTNPPVLNGQHLWLSSIECCVFAKKPKAIFKRHCKSCVWRFPVGRNEIHPTQKPEDLLKYLIESSSNDGDTVLDPCSGSGSTGVACIQAGRKYVGIELNEGFFEASRDRLEKMEHYERTHNLFATSACV